MRTVGLVFPIPAETVKVEETAVEETAEVEEPVKNETEEKK